MSKQSRACCLTVPSLWTTSRSNLDERSVCLPTYVSVCVPAVECLCRVTQATSALQEQRMNNSCLTGFAQLETALAAVPSSVRPVSFASTCIYIEIS
jgi:hypothetical protein